MGLLGIRNFWPAKSSTQVRGLLEEKVRAELGPQESSSTSEKNSLKSAVTWSATSPVHTLLACSRSRYRKGQSEMSISENSWFMGVPTTTKSTEPSRTLCHRLASSPSRPS